MQDRSNMLWIVGGFIVGIIMYFGMIWAAASAQSTSTETDHSTVTVPLITGADDATTTRAEEMTLYVGPTLIDCQGATAQKCMQVKQNPDAEYEPFYDQIEGFDYEEGYEYELRVSVESLENPPADGSATRWMLIEVVRKTEMPSSFEGNLWKLVSYRDSEGNTVTALPDSEITALFQEGQVVGSAGCNSFFGTYQVDGETLTIDVGGATEMFCAPEELMAQENTFLAAMDSAAAYRVRDQQLHIVDSHGETVLTFATSAPLSPTETSIPES